MTEDPRPAELARRIDELARRQDSGFRDIGSRLDQMADEKTLLALFASRDGAITGLVDDVKSLTAALDAERVARQAAISKVEDDRKADRKWTFGAIITAGGLVLAVIVNIAQGLPA